MLTAGGGYADASFGDLEDFGEGGFELIVDGVDLGSFAFEHEADCVDFQRGFLDFLEKGCEVFFAVYDAFFEEGVGVVAEGFLA